MFALNEHPPLTSKRTRERINCKKYGMCYVVAAVALMAAENRLLTGSLNFVAKSMEHRLAPDEEDPLFQPNQYSPFLITFLECMVAFKLPPLQLQHSWLASLIVDGCETFWQRCLESAV